MSSHQSGFRPGRIERILRWSVIVLACASVLFLITTGLWFIGETVGTFHFVNHAGSPFARPTLAIFLGLSMLLAAGLWARIARRVIAPLYAPRREELPAVGLERFAGRKHA